MEHFPREVFLLFFLMNIWMRKLFPLCQIVCIWVKLMAQLQQFTLLFFAAASFTVGVQTLRHITSRGRFIANAFSTWSHASMSFFQLTSVTLSLLCFLCLPGWLKRCVENALVYSIHRFLSWTLFLHSANWKTSTLEKQTAHQIYDNK